eukprot:gene594-376_t
MVDVHSLLENEHTKHLPMAYADEIEIGSRKCIESKSGRHIILMRHGPTDFTAMDTFCHHKGLSLAVGDIEDIGGDKNGELFDSMNKCGTGTHPQRTFRCTIQAHPQTGASMVFVHVTGSKGDPGLGQVESDKQNGLLDEDVPLYNSPARVGTFRGRRAGQAAAAVRRKLQISFSQETSASYESGGTTEDVDMSP